MSEETQPLYLKDIFNLGFYRHMNINHTVQWAQQIWQPSAVPMWCENKQFVFINENASGFIKIWISFKAKQKSLGLEFGTTWGWIMDDNFHFFGDLTIQVVQHLKLWLNQWPESGAGLPVLQNNGRWGSGLAEVLGILLGNTNVWHH